MTFDLNTYDPWVSTMTDTGKILQALAFPMALCFIFGLLLTGTMPNITAEDKHMLKKRRLYHWGCGLCVIGTLISVLILGIPEQYRPVSVSTYLNEQTSMQTGKSLTGIDCQTPQFSDISNDEEETTGRYPCSWRFDGKTINGTIMSTDPKSGPNHLPRKATLLDSHGDAWCPTDWKTAHGCEPILTDTNHAESALPEETR